MKKILFTGLSIGMLLLGPVVAQAYFYTYADRSSFNSAVGITPIIDFEAQQKHPAAYTYYGSNLTVGNVSFTQANSLLFVMSSSIYSTSGTSNYLYNNGGLQPIVINFASDVSDVGMDLGWLASWNGSGSTMYINFAKGGYAVSFPTGVAGPLIGTGTPLGFLGFHSDIPFSSMSFSDPSRVVMIDNFAYSPTPEPATMLLLGTGLAALAGARKLKKLLPA